METQTGNQWGGGASSGAEAPGMWAGFGDVAGRFLGWLVEVGKWGTFTSRCDI